MYWLNRLFFLKLKYMKNIRTNKYECVCIPGAKCNSYLECLSKN